MTLLIDSGGIARSFLVRVGCAGSAPLGDGDSLAGVILRCSGSIVCTAALVDSGIVADTRVSVGALVNGGGVVVAAFLLDACTA